ncbi:hypothetical protein [Streptomyces radicis]|nr:hypothetical protein [Streptomyces radicis]
MSDEGAEVLAGGMDNAGAVVRRGAVVERWRRRNASRLSEALAPPTHP